MDLDLLKRCSIILATASFIGCSGTNQNIKKELPSWVLDPTQNGKYKDAVSSCYINNKNYPIKKVKKILIMKAKSSRSFQDNATVETKQTKYNHSFNKISRQSSSNSYVKEFKILDKYKHNNEYCLHINFNK